MDSSCQQDFIPPTFAYILSLFNFLLNRLPIYNLLQMPPPHSLNSPSSSPRRTSSQAHSPSSTNNDHIFLSGLSGSTHSQDLKQSLMQHMGSKYPIVSIDVRKSYNNSYSFAFIQLRDRNQVDQFISEFDRSMFEGRRLRVERQHQERGRRRSRSRGKETEGRRCYVCNKPGHLAR